MKHRFTILRYVALLVLLSGAPVISSANVATPLTESQSQQTRTIRGVITDALGVPVIGATVSIKGTTNATLSNVDGQFELKVKSSDTTLEVKFLGLKTVEIPLTAANNYDIVMEEDAQMIDDVVVVGYGTQKKATVTGSVAQVSGKSIEQAHTANLSNTLVGRMTGVIGNNRSGQPGEDNSNLLIRGKATLGNNSPLYVIDGVANRGGIDRLNPADIESISVLKDASAAIYGAQAANGVILVTTKRGQSGKPTLTYDGSFTLQQPTRRPNWMNAYQYMNYDDEINRYKGSTELYKDIKGGYLDGTIDSKKWADTDWYNAVMRELTPQTQHSVALRGGTENVKYFVSTSYLYQEYAYRNSDRNFNTLQMRSNIDANITKDLKFTFDMSARQENRNAPVHSTGTIFWETMHAYPFLHDYYDNGLPGAGITAGRNPVLLGTSVPGYQKVRDNFVNTRMAFDLQMPWVTKGLSMSGYVAYDMRFRAEKKLMDQWDAYSYDAANDKYINVRPSSGDGYISLNQRQDDESRLTIHGRISYDRTFGDHSVSVFAAYEQSKFNNDWFNAYRRDFLSSEVDYLFAGADPMKDNNGAASIEARQNLFGRANYAYKNKYLAEFTLRYDGSQNFAKAGRWGLFPGVSVGWRIGQENFMKNADWVNELKLRASWGKLGNDRVSPFQYLSTFTLNTNDYGAAIFGEDPQLYKGFLAGRLANQSITWEVVETKNIGVDGTFWNGMLSFSAQYFHSMRTNILTKKQASIPDYTGIVLPDQNIGEISNRGVEIELSHTQTLGDWSYFVGGNFSFIRNKIHYFDEASNVPEWQRRTGGKIDSFIGYKSNGIYQNQAQIDGEAHMSGAKPGDIRYVDTDGDGKITSTDRIRFQITPIPEIVYGITLGGSWKGLEMNMLFQGQARAQQMIRPYSYNFDQSYYEGRWISETETPNAKYPRATYFRNDTFNSVDSDFWLRDASFLRLKNMEIAYNLPQRWLDKAKIERLRVFVAGTNLFVFDKIKIEDPEAGSNDSFKDGSNAYNNGQYYPLQRTFSVGLNITF